MDATQIESAVGEYQDILSRYQGFVNALKLLLKQLLSTKDIRVVNIEARAKTIESFRAKIEREDKNYSDPLKQVMDLAGIRIITYQISDIEPISDLIKEAFSIDEKNSVDKSKFLETDRFGYLSIHYVIQLNELRSKLPEYVSFAGMSAEIQIRTVLQHAWAAIDHKLRYKSKEEVPAKLRRKLFRISALLEIADEEFEALTVKMKEVRTEYSDAVTRGSLDIPLNIDSLTIYMRENQGVHEIIDKAVAAGFHIAPHPPIAKLPEYSHLFFLLDASQIRNLSQFDNVIKRQIGDSPSLFSDIVIKWKSRVSDKNLKLVATRDSLFRMIFFVSLPLEEASRVKRFLRASGCLGEAIEEEYRVLHDTKDFSIFSEPVT
jgi:putative GTP pyrophosphokinase